MRKSKNDQSVCPRRFARLLLATLAMVACVINPFSERVAGKPPKDKPGGGGGDDVSGVIYFRHQGELWRMDADGRNKALTGVSYGEPSEEKHGGHRWFLQFREIANETYPDGRQRVELHAIRDDGQSVRLTNQSAVEPLRNPRWAIDDLEDQVDGVVSWIARRWDATGEVVDGGVYRAFVEFDAGGNVVGLEQPAELLVPLELVVDGDGNPPTPNVHSHDWAPNSSAVVFDTFDDDVIVAHLLAETLTVLPINARAREPEWSPDGTKIGYFAGTTDRDEIRTIGPDGAGESTLFSVEIHRAGFVIGGPHWSPASDHLTYTRWSKKGQSNDIDVWRMEVTGVNQTNLTRDLNTDFWDGSGAFSRAWR